MKLLIPIVLFSKRKNEDLVEGAVMLKFSRFGKLLLTRFGLLVVRVFRLPISFPIIVNAFTCKLLTAAVLLENDVRFGRLFSVAKLLSLLLSKVLIVVFATFITLLPSFSYWSWGKSLLENEADLQPDRLREVSSGSALPLK